MPRNLMSGEISTSQLSASDQAYYQSAAKKIDGFIVTPEGGATMAPGTIYTATTKESSKVRLDVFIYSEEDVYVLEIGPLYIRFYRNNLQVGAPTEVTTTYTADEIWELDISVQLADTLYIAHGSHQRAKLVRSSHTSWTLSDLEMTDGPFRDENTSATTLTASAVTGTGITLTASVATFTAVTDIGSIWQISHEVSETEVSNTFNAVANSSSVFVQRDSQWRIVLIPDASWNGTVEVQLSYDDSDWFTDQTPLQGTNIDRQTLNGVPEDDNVYVRLSCTARTAGTVKYYLYANSYVHNGIAVITAVASTTSATATVLTDLISTDATTKWSEGSWSLTRGFPTACFFYANRICWAGNSSQPQHIWPSAQNDFESHREGTKDTDAFQQPLDGAMASPIRWVIVEDKGLIVGTLGQVILYFPQDATLSAKPTNLFTKRTAASHSNGFIRPIQASGSILMTEFGGRAVKELLFSDRETSMLVPDLTRFAKHLMNVDDANGIVDVAFQRRPFPILWCVRSDGLLMALSYDRAIEQVSWSRITLSGSVESVAVIPKSNYDQVWVSSLHTIDGSEVRYVSYMDELNLYKPIKDMHFVEAGLKWKGGTANVTAITQAAQCTVTLDAWPTDTDGDMADTDNIKFTGVVGMTELNDMVFTVSDANSVALTLKLKDSESVGYIDSTGFTAYESGGVLSQVENSFGGLSHLEGEEVYVTTNGNSYVTDTVASGAISTDDYVNSASVGKYMTREIILLPYEGPKTLGKSKHVVGQMLGVFRTIGGRYGPANYDGTLEESRARDIDYARVFDAWDWDTDVYTGIKHITDNWGVSQRHTMIIQQPGPVPMTVLMVEPEIEGVS